MTHPSIESASTIATNRALVHSRPQTRRRNSHDGPTAAGLDLGRVGYRSETAPRVIRSKFFLLLMFSACCLTHLLSLISEEHHWITGSL